MRATDVTGVRASPAPRLRIDSRRRWFPDLRQLFRARHLVALLGRRDITAKYRQTVLGTVYIFTGPLISAGLFTFVFGRVADLPSDGNPYFAFSYAGLLGWNLFSSTLSAVSTSLNSNSSLISKIYFPRLVIPLSTVATTLINTAVSTGVMAVLLVVYDIGVTWRLVFFPVWLLIALTLAMGVGLVLGGIAVSYRDVNYVTPVFTSLMMYLSPVAYSTDAVPESIRSFYQVNPLTTIVEGCRWSLLGESNLTPGGLAYTVGLTLAALAIGAAAFTRLESRFADVI